MYGISQTTYSYLLPFIPVVGIDSTLPSGKSDYGSD